MYRIWAIAYLWTAVASCCVQQCMQSMQRTGKYRKPTNPLQSAYHDPIEYFIVHVAHAAPVLDMVIVDAQAHAA